MMRPLLCLVALLGACTPAGTLFEDTGLPGAGDGGSGDDGSGDDGGSDGGSDGDSDGGPGEEIEQVPGGGGGGGDDGGLSADDLFGNEVIPTFELELSDEAFASLASDPYEWVEGALIFEGERYEPVAVRTKGENSWQPITDKPSLKVKLDAYDDGPGDLFGLEELTFQNMDNDYAMMHERVAYRLYREAGVPAARANHMWLELNGEDYGLYTFLETVDRDMMKRWREVKDSRMFEQWDVDFYDGYVPYFELEFGDDDRTNLQGVADAMEGQVSWDANIEAASEHIDYDSFLRYWAVGAVVGQFDSYPYSNPGDDCHVFDNPETGKLEYVPHGMDEAFYYPDHNVRDNAGGILSYACRQSPDCLERFYQHVDDVLDIADDIDHLGYHDEVAEQISELTRDDRNKPYTNNEVDYWQSAMRSFIANRRSALQSQIGVGGD